MSFGVVSRPAFGGSASSAQPSHLSHLRAQPAQLSQLSSAFSAQPAQLSQLSSANTPKMHHKVPLQLDGVKVVEIVVRIVVFALAQLSQLSSAQLS